MAHTTATLRFREESLEFRNHAISDELVYFCETPERNLERGYRLVNWGPDYKIGRCWIDLYFILDRNRNNQFLATIESSPIPLDSLGGNLKIESGMADRHRGVLVDIAQLIKLPKGVTPEPLSSIIRLKILDDVPCLSGNILGAGLKPRSSRRAVDRKGRVSGLAPTQQRKMPHKLIQSRPQVVGKLTNKEGNFDWKGRTSNLKICTPCSRSSLPEQVTASCLRKTSSSRSSFLRWRFALRVFSRVYSNPSTIIFQRHSLLPVHISQRT